MSGLKFVVMLFAGALCGFLLAGIALIDHVDSWLYWQSGTMVSHDPVLARIAKINSFDPIQIEVTYQTGKGAVVVPDKAVQGDVLQRLVKGEGVPVSFDTKDPHRVRYDGDTLPNPWGWLLVGVSCFLVGRYAKRLMLREASQRA